MKLVQHELVISTPGRGMIDVSAELRALVAKAGLRVGLCTVFVRHTSASLVIQENLDPAVLRDLAHWIGDLAPEARAWEHDDEGADDMPAHARAAVTRTSETIPIRDGALALGRWQALYLWEHRSSPHQRTLIVTLMGETQHH